MIRCTVFCWLGLMVAATAGAQTDYDFLLKGGHVIDGKNGISAVRDVAIKDGRIAAVTTNIAAARALKTIDATGFYVTPGLFDMHVHVYHGEIPNGYAKGDRSFNPDGFTLRSCVTTVTDAGSAGWRNFDDFKSRIIDNAKTRVTAFLNIVGHGMAGRPTLEQDLADMEVLEYNRTASPASVRNAIINAASLNRLAGVPAGTANRLLFWPGAQ